MTSMDGSEDPAKNWNSEVSAIGAAIFHSFCVSVQKTNLASLKLFIGK